MAIRITDANLVIENPQQLTDKILQMGKKKFVRLVD